MHLTIATRSSKLALWQTRWIMQVLQETYPGVTCKEVPISTQGDKVIDTPLPAIGGKGLFTSELEHELLAGSVHAAVHSLKDLPVENAPGLVIGALPVRGEVRDALISAHGNTLENLPTGARVGTSSTRRAAQVLIQRPDVSIVPLRGNVDTRLKKALDGLYDAIIVAGAALDRLGLLQSVSQWLPLDVMLPAPGQGAVAVQCRGDDSETLALLAKIDNTDCRMAVTAEREFLAGLGGGCAAPVAAYARFSGNSDSDLILDGLVASLDGKQVVRVSGSGSDPAQVGRDLAKKALAEGAAEIINSPTTQPHS